MEFTDYQTFVNEIAFYPNVGNNHIYPILGLCGETGEVAEKIKKSIRDGIDDQEKFKEELKKELGDILWYIAAASMEFGFTLEDVAQANYDKLMSRKQRDVLHGSGDNR